MTIYILTVHVTKITLLLIIIKKKLKVPRCQIWNYNLIFFILNKKPDTNIIDVWKLITEINQ